MVRTIINVTKQDQYRTTLPKALMEARGVKPGDQIEYTSMGDKIVMEIIRK